MISVHPTYFYLLLEALAGVTVLALMLGLMLLRRRRHRRTTLVDLVQRIKSTGDARREGITRVLQESGVSDEERLAALAQQVLAAETQFYQFLVRALLSSDDRTLLDLDRQVEALTDAITRCSPVMKHQAVATASSAPAVASEINAELGQIKQVVTALQTSHQQALAEVKSSVASVRDALKQIAGQGVIAVAAAGGAAALAEAPLPDHDDNSAPTPTHDALESLPDIDDAASPVSAATTSTNDTMPAAPAPQPEPAPAQALDIDQIAEIPDELLMGTSEVAAHVEPAATAEDNSAPVSAELSLESDRPAEPTQDVESSATETSVAPQDEALLEETVSTPAPAAVAPTAADPNANQADTAALIDDLLADAAATSKATLASTQATPVIAEQSNSPAAELSVDEIYAAEPLIPDSDEQPARAPTAQTSPAPSEASAESGSAKQEAGQSKNYGNVDDLLAELDDLLK